MKTRSYFTSMTMALAGAFLATFFLIACQQSQQPQAPAATQSTVASTEKVFVVFEGPWAFVDDPKDANSVLALAPKTKLHRDLYVSASNDSTLAAGTYDLSVPAHGPAFSGVLDPSFAQAKIDAKACSTRSTTSRGAMSFVCPSPRRTWPPRESVVASAPAIPPMLRRSSLTRPLCRSATTSAV